jgi:hypothetical protein
MKLRFSIRQLAVLIVILALACGWWADHRHLESQLTEVGDAFSKQIQENLRYHEFRAGRITTLLADAEKSAPSPEVAAEVLDTVRNDPDWSIKVRAMAILPYLKEREDAIDALIDATKIHDVESSGGGNVPFYAVSYLAEMKAGRGISAVAEWVEFIKHQYPYDAKVHELILKRSEKHLADLEAAENSHK